jgi:hypothetical protein
MSFKNNYRVRKRESDSMATLATRCTLVWEEIENEQTELKTKVQFIYRFDFKMPDTILAFPWPR